MTEQAISSFRIDRLPKNLQSTFRELYSSANGYETYLQTNEIHHGDARTLLPEIEPNSIALSIWSPPYFVGKDYESYLTFEDWEDLLKTVISLHFSIIKPGGFLAINIADILCFKDAEMPRIQADAVTKKRSPVTKDDVLKAIAQHPTYSRHQLATLLGCSEQTIDRRLHGNNIRGGKHDTQTRIKIVGGLIESWALNSGFYPYDRRIWIKDAAWENSRWASLSYRSVDEFEYLYIFWKPGITKFDRGRLSQEEWRDWGSRGVWQFPSVRANDDHEAKFPLELPLRTIKLLTDSNEIVLDCFMGSGTTAIAAIQTGRQYIGIDLVEKYVDLARAKIAAGTQIRLISERKAEQYAYQSPGTRSAS